ncbi:MAG: LamG domain-containing protein [Nitrosopumilus sp.]
MVLYERPSRDIDQGLVGYWKLDDLKRISTDGIVAHYKMNDNSADTDVLDSKDGNIGTAERNTSLLTTVSGKIGRALVFDGTNDQITIPNKSVLELQEHYTVALWVKITGIEVGISELITSRTTENHFLLRREADDTLRFFDWTGNGSENILISDSALTVDTWYHVMLIRDGTDLTMYLNNTAQADTETTSGTISYSDATIILGAAAGGANNLAGTMDDIRIYNIALSASERAAVYNSGTGTETTELFRDTIVAIDRAKFNDGTIDGCTNAEGINGINPDAMSFDGVDDSIDVGTKGIHDFTTTQRFSISLWAKANADESTDRLIYRRTGSTGFIIQTRSDGTYEVLVGNGSSIPSVVINGAQSGKREHLVFTYDGDIVRAYLNGAYVNKGTIGTYVDSNTSLFIGNNTTGTSTSCFPGSLQKIRLYNRTLTSGEASKLHRLRE